MFALLALLLLPAFGPAQDNTAEIERMVADGMAEALEARFGATRRPESLHALARAWTNRARQTPDERRKARAYEQANEKYEAWIEVLVRDVRRADGVVPRTRMVAALVEYAGVILSGQTAGILDTLEITAGERGDRDELTKWLNKAANLYENAEEAAPRLVELTNAQEEALLAAGLYDTLRQAELDGKFNRGWVEYHQGVLTEDDAAARAGHLARAERLFRELLDSEQTGQMESLCQMALGMARREQGRYGDAKRNFERALAADPDTVTTARIRYELARCLLADKQYDAARELLAPLVDLDPARLPAEYQPARFYVNLAHVWHAYSYMVEANAVRERARGTAAEAAQLQRAVRLRESGLARLNQLAERGAPWPALVQIYIARSVDLKTPLLKLTPVELYYTATVEIGQGRYERARERLETAIARDDAPADVVADCLFELGRCEYQLRRYDDAAEAFTRLATEHREHRRASQGATYAYELWAKVAQQTGDEADYARLANVLRVLLQSYADHPQRDEAAWLLPVSLQAAGEYAEASRQFAKVQPGSRHWDEARFRAALCARQALLAQRGGLDAAEFVRRAKEVAHDLRQYADNALERADRSIQPGKLRKWSAEARIGAAELLAARDVAAYDRALEAVAKFEQQYPDHADRGDVLNVRIRAYCGLRQFEQAATMLKAYLPNAPAEQAGPTLVTLAQGMQGELERLLEAGKDEAAAALARDSVETFAQLEKWVRADEDRASNLPYVLLGRARMLYYARQLDEALQIVDAQLAKQPKNGNFQHLRAAILEARLGDSPGKDAIEQARDAWGALLVDPAIRRRAPERYWQARYHWLDLTLRLGQAAEVVRQISQEQVLYPELGGEPWKSRLEALEQQARRAAGGEP